MTTDIAMKYAAILFLLIVAVSAIGLAVYDVINNQAIPEYVSVIIGSGLTYSLTVLGINHGATVAMNGVNNNATK